MPTSHFHAIHIKRFFKLNINIYRLTGALVSQLISFRSKSNPVAPTLDPTSVSNTSPIPGNNAFAASTAPPGVGGGALAAGLGPSFSVQRGALGVGTLHAVVAVVVVIEPLFGCNVDGPVILVAVWLWSVVISVILSAKNSRATTQRWTMGESCSKEWIISSA